jgi:hypothetical protein
LRHFLLQSGYVGDRLTNELGLHAGLFADLTNLHALLARTDNEGRLPFLARLFFVGWPVDAETCQQHVPDTILQLCLRTGLLAAADATLSPNVILVPFGEDLLFACDAPRLQIPSSEVVIGPGSATFQLAKAMPQTGIKTVLDLGTGTGVLAVMAAAFSEQVTATDINERAISFARFNAALNRVANIEFLVGDSFVPVTGRQFTHIVSNPPFIIGGNTRFGHCESPMELDGFTLKLLAEAPAYLQDGGAFQMIGEWVQFDLEDDWERRPRLHTTNSGCDTLILAGARRDAVEYAEQRSRETANLYAENASELITARLNYLRSRHVETVTTGLVTLRKRHGNNWFTAARADLRDISAVSIQERVEAMTFLTETDQRRWLKMAFRLADGVTVTQANTYRQDQWTLSRMELSRGDGVRDAVKIDAPVLQTVEMFDGSTTLDEIITQVRDALAISEEEATQRCLHLTKRLLQGGILLPARSSSSSNPQ